MKHLDRTSRHVGRCAACEKPIDVRDTSIRMYGEMFHHDCAFYRAVG